MLGKSAAVEVDTCCLERVSSQFVVAHPQSSSVPPISY
jgi:hypothetical protein